MAHLNRRKIARREGRYLAVKRPTNAARALELAKSLAEELMPQPVEEQNAEVRWAQLEAQLNEEAGPYTFVGFLDGRAADGGEAALLDFDGNRVGAMEPGDSFMLFTDDDARHNKIGTLASELVTLDN